MHEIPLTRSDTAAGDAVSSGVLTALAQVGRTRRHWVVVAVTFAYVAGLALLTGSGPGRAALIATAITVALVVAVVGTTISAGRRVLSRDLGPGSVSRAGVVAGYLRVQHPTSDCIYSAEHFRAPVVRRRHVVLVQQARPAATIVPRALLPDADLAVLASPPVSATLPARPEGDVVLTRQFLADERWSRRVGRAMASAAQRSPEWWVRTLLVAGAAGVTMVVLVAVLDGRSVTSGSVLPAAVVAVLLVGVRAWNVYRCGRRLSQVSPEDALWTFGLGPTSYRWTSLLTDVVVPYSAVREVRVEGDTVLLRQARGIGHRLPRELVSDRDLDLLRDAIAATSGTTRSTHPD